LGLVIGEIRRWSWRCRAFWVGLGGLGALLSLAAILRL
jgi:hypothetical protein